LRPSGRRIAVLPAPDLAEKAGPVHVGGGVGPWRAGDLVRPVSRGLPRLGQRIPEVAGARDAHATRARPPGDLGPAGAAHPDGGLGALVADRDPGETGE